MKVHPESLKQFKLHDCPESIPDEMLNEEWAGKNHGQTLKRLNERGGMGIREIIANIKCEKIKHDATLADLIELKIIISNHKRRERESNRIS